MADPVADEWVTVPDDEWIDVADEKAPAQRWAEARGVPPGLATRFASEAQRIDAQTPMSNLADVGGALLLGGGWKLLSKVPAGRLLTTGVAAAKAGAAKLPIIGPPVRAAVKAGAEAWKASAPAVPAVVKAAAGAKPKLSAPEVAAKMREMYGSEKAGRMLYGTARPGVSAAARSESIRRLTPQMQSTLPKAAQNAINRELASSTPEEAFAYAAKATNDPARGYLGDLLRRTLLERGGK